MCKDFNQYENICGIQIPLLVVTHAQCLCYFGGFWWFAYLCSVWLLLFNRSFARWIVPTLLAWDHNRITWSIPRVILSCIQFPWRGEEEPVCRSFVRVWCYCHGLSATVWGLPPAATIFNSPFSSRLWKLAIRLEPPKCCFAPLRERGLAPLGVSFI